VNEWLWIAPLLYFLISAMGNSAAKKAKGSAQRARQERAPQTAELRDVTTPAQQAGVDPGALGSPVPQTTSAVPTGSGRKRSADTIAAEIRRMMGLPPESEPEPVFEQSMVDDSAEPVAAPAVGDTRVLSHGGDLHERLRAREAEGRHSAGVLENRHLEDRQAALVNRHSTSSVGRSSRGSTLPSAGTGRRSYVRTHDIAQAFVMAEILGRPKALRSEEW
jgi:hypothetical protein